MQDLPNTPKGLGIKRDLLPLSTKSSSTASPLTLTPTTMSAAVTPTSAATNTPINNASAQRLISPVNRRFSRSGFNLGITISDNQQTVKSPLGSPDLNRKSMISRSPSMRSSSYSMNKRSSLIITSPISSNSSTVNSPRIASHFATSNAGNSNLSQTTPQIAGNLRRSTSMYYHSPSTNVNNSILQLNLSQMKNSLSSKSLEATDPNSNTPSTITYSPAPGSTTSMGGSGLGSISNNLDDSFLEGEGSNSEIYEEDHAESDNAPIKNNNSIEDASLPKKIDPIDDTTEKLRLLAMKEMRVVELRDEIRNLTIKLQYELKELLELKQIVESSLTIPTSHVTSPTNSVVDNRSRTNSILSGILGDTENDNNAIPNSRSNQSGLLASTSSSSITTSGGVDTPTNTGHGNSLKRMSSMWDSISKPLNLISQFDSMIQSEFEKISMLNGESTISLDKKSQNSPSKNKSFLDIMSSSIQETDDFFKWDEYDEDHFVKFEDDEEDEVDKEQPGTPSKPARILHVNPKSKSHMVLTKNSQFKSHDPSMSLSRKPSYRRAVNMDKHKIIIPKRNRTTSNASSSLDSPSSINPIMSLADSMINSPKKDEVLQSVSSSLWNFYSDVKDGLMFSDEKERIVDLQKNNTTVVPDYKRNDSNVNGTEEDDIPTRRRA